MRNDGGPAFPQEAKFGTHFNGMSLRDYFACNSPTGEVQEIIYKSLSRNAQELLVGRKYPVREPHGQGKHADEMAFQLAELDFLCAVNAAVRFKLADAMIAERNKEAPDVQP